MNYNLFCLFLNNSPRESRPKENNLYLLACVYYVTKRNGEASMSEFVEAFDGSLSQKQVRTLIEKLCGYHILSQHGNARATRYVWAAG